jgi:hypothetical protein
MTELVERWDDATWGYNESIKFDRNTSMMRVTQPEHPCSVVQSGGAARQRAADFTLAKARIHCAEV